MSTRTEEWLKHKNRLVFTSCIYNQEQPFSLSKAFVLFHIHPQPTSPLPHPTHTRPQWKQHHFPAITASFCMSQGFVEVNFTVLISGFDCETKTWHFTSERSEAVSNCSKKFWNMMTEPGSVYICMHTHTSLCYEYEYSSTLSAVFPSPVKLSRQKKGWSFLRSYPEVPCYWNLLKLDIVFSLLWCFLFVCCFF